MNAIAPVPQFLPSNDPPQFKSGDNSQMHSSGADSQDFSSAMHVASIKPARKSTPSRTSPSSQSGNASPASGNPSPSALPPRHTPAANASNSSGGANAASHPANAPVSTAGAVSAPGSSNAPGSTATIATAAVPGSQNGAASDPSVSGRVSGPIAPAAVTADAPAPQAAGPALAMPNGGAATDQTGAADAAAAAAALASATADATTATAAPVATDKSASAAAVTQAAQPAPRIPPASAKLGGNLATSAALRANRTTGSNTTDNAATGSSSSGATSVTDTTAPALMAPAAAQSASDSGTDGGASQNFLGAPGTSAKTADAPGAAPGNAAPAIMPAVVPAAAGSHAAAPASASTTNARAITDLAVLNLAADKAVHVGSADLSTAGVANDGSVGAAQVLAGARSTDTTTAPTFKIPAAVETTEFGQGVADRVSFMVDGNVSSAKLQVNPPALGPIEVRIALQGTHAQVSFTSHSALTRDALELSAPKLREMLGAQGFGQVSVDVSQGSFQDRSTQSSPYQPSAGGGRDSSVDAAQSLSHTGPRVAIGVLDAYA